MMRELQQVLLEGWVTMNGTPVLIGDDGEIKAGPKELVKALRAEDRYVGAKFEDTRGDLIKIDRVVGDKALTAAGKKISIDEVRYALAKDEELLQEYQANPDASRMKLLLREMKSRGFSEKNFEEDMKHRAAGTEPKKLKDRAQYLLREADRLQTEEANLKAAKAFDEVAKQHRKDGKTWEAESAEEMAVSFRSWARPEVREFRAIAKEHWHSLTAEEKVAQQYYQGAGSIWMNNALRTGAGTVAVPVDSSGPRKDLDLDEIKTAVQNLDSAMKSKLAKDTTARRYIAADSTLMSKLKPGVIFSDHGYVSTSLPGGDFKPYMKYELRGGKKLVRIELALPKGTKGALFGNGGKHPLNEFLLPRGSSFEIHDVKEHDGEVVVRASLAKAKKLEEGHASLIRGSNDLSRFVWDPKDLVFS